MNTTIFSKLFDTAGVEGFLHAKDLGSGREIGHHPDASVIAASVFKVPVLVELYRQADAGMVDLEEQITVPVEARAPGPTGLSAMIGPVTLCWRDLAQSMISVSDNAATDVICARVGLDAVNDAMRRFGLVGTVVEADCRGVFAQMAEDVGVRRSSDIKPSDADRVLRSRALTAETSNRTTPREISRLMELIWTDTAASTDSCAQMRRILTSQVWPHRLASGFPEDGIATAGKTGTLVVVRNEAGMVSLPGGRHVSVSVFTRSRGYRAKHPAQDAVIGKAARAAVDILTAS